MCSSRSTDKETLGLVGTLCGYSEKFASSESHFLLQTENLVEESQILIASESMKSTPFGGPG